MSEDAGGAGGGGLIQSLPPGPVDIIGDVHGELGALQSLLDRLGYDQAGVHPHARTLVFVGDYIDRGPDSPGVVRLLRRLMSGGGARAVLGNHELNALLGRRRHGNAWLYNEREVLVRRPADADGDDAAAHVNLQVLTGDEERRELLQMLLALPLALERADLRVVHAEWNADAVRALRPHKDVLAAFEHFSGAADAKVERRKRWRMETAAAADSEADDDDVEAELIYQNDNPVKVLSSGREQRSPKRFFAGGKWRSLCRVPWWREYGEEEPLTVFGHYWRRTAGSSGEDGADSRRGEITDPDDVFAGENAFSLLVENSLLFFWKVPNAMCVDYSIGRRYEERAYGERDGARGTALAALRIPEMELLLADGTRVPVQPPSTAI